jgi:hypothetical protein
MKLWSQTTIWTVSIVFKQLKLKSHKHRQKETHLTNFTNQSPRCKTICFNYHLSNRTINKSSNSSSSKLGLNLWQWISIVWRVINSATLNKILWKMLFKLDTEIGTTSYKFRMALLRALPTSWSKRKNEKLNWRRQRNVLNSWRNSKSIENERCSKKWSNSRWRGWRRRPSWSKHTW